MAKVVISDLGPYDGTYELDLAFTHRDFHEIKKVAGVRANEVMDAIEAGDLDVIVALACIALRRAGHPYDVEQLWDSPVGGIVLDADEDGAEVVETPQPSADATGNDGSGGASGTPTNNGTDSSPETETPDYFGTPLPESTSDPETLTT